MEFLANGYSSDSTQQEFSNEYQHDRVQVVLKILLRPCALAKVASALERLRMVFASKYRLITIIGLIPQFGHYKSCAQHQSGIFGVFLLTFIQKTECLFQHFLFHYYLFLGWRKQASYLMSYKSESSGIQCIIFDLVNSLWHISTVHLRI